MKIRHFLRCLAPLLLPLTGVAAPPSPSSWDSVPAECRSSLQQAVQESTHAFHPTDAGWAAPNPGHEWTARTDAAGFSIEPRPGGESWGLELTEYGFPGHEQPAVPAANGRTEQHTHLTVSRGAELDEWFVNDARGLEHGFTVHQRPAGSGAELALHFTVRGGLTPGTADAGSALHFKNAAGSTAWTYSGLKAWDATGRTLRSWFTLEGGSRVALRVEESGARYPLTIDPLIQQAFLKASNADAGDFFGSSVATHLDAATGKLWAVVGSPGESSAFSGVNATQTDNSMQYSGAAYVFVRSGETWTQHAYLKASNPGTGDRFGASVAIHGRAIIVGAPGESSEGTGRNGEQYAPSFYADRGAAYVFMIYDDVWVQTAYLKRPASGAGSNSLELGTSVAVSGDGTSYTFLIGAPINDGLNVDFGAAHVWQGSTLSAWSGPVVLQASNPGHGDRFGYRVAVDGNICSVSAPGEDSDAVGINAPLTGGSGTQANNSNAEAGAVYAFTRPSAGAGWTQEAYLKSHAFVSSRYGFGNGLAISGQTVAVGMTSPDGGVYVFTRSSGTWAQQAFLRPAAAADSFGDGLALAGDRLAVASGYLTDEFGTARDGVVLYSRSGGIWQQTEILRPIQQSPPSFPDFAYGEAMALASDGTILAGAPYEDSSARSINPLPYGGTGTQQDNNRAESGAVIVFGTAADIAVYSPAGAPQMLPGAPWGMGNRPIGNQSAEQRFTIDNAGTSTLHSIAVSLSGANAADFILTQPSKTSLTTTQDTSITIRFAPQPGPTGTRTATLSIASNDPDENPFTILLSGTATPEEPWVVTTAPVVNSSTSVTIGGYVEPRGFSVNHGLQYGTTAAVGAGDYTFVPFFGAPSNSIRSFSTPITVAANEDYVVRAYAFAPGSTWYGEWMPFSTKPRGLWAQQYFGNSALSAASALTHADADGDGITNLQEWIGGTSPNMPTTMPGFVPVTVFGQPWLSFSYPLNNNRNGDEWIRVESSTDLQTWTAGNTWDLLPSGFPFDAGLAFPDGPRRFVRMASGIHTTVRIPTLFNTGVDAAGAALPDADGDPHYTILFGMDSVDAQIRTSARGWPVEPGVWMPETSTSNWIQPKDFSEAGAYRYSTTFNIPWGVDLTQVSITGRMAADDSIALIRLNGAIIPLSFTGYSTWSPEWIITRGFVTGTNTLEFAVNNGGTAANPTGFRAEVSGTWQASGMVPIPGLRSSGTSVLDGSRMAQGWVYTGCYTDYGFPRVRSVAGWMGDTGNVGSAWLTPFSDDNAEPGTYTYTVPFDLTTFDPQTVEIAGRFAFDDECMVLLNGTIIVPNVTWNGTQWVPFSISREHRHLLQPGQNSLQFIVYNANPGSNNPTGLRYEFLHAVAMPSAQ